MDPNTDHPIFNPELFNRSVQIDRCSVDLKNEIVHSGINLPNNPVVVSGMVDFEPGPTDSIVKKEESGDSKKLNVQNGCNIAKDNHVLISAYDESIATYSTLEGKVEYISHSIVHMFRGEYYPCNMLNILFCTASKIIQDKIPNAIPANPDWGVDTTLNVEVSRQKGKFIIDNCYANSIVLIDGPYLAGDGLAYYLPAIKGLLKNNIVPVFLVKNSFSSLLVDNLDGLKGKYNSDLHWANVVLKEGERTPFFRYTDVNSKDKTKVFCYLKHKNGYSPLRVEFPSEIFDNNRFTVENVMDLVIYLILVQGSLINPQARPVAIAEKYARETLKLIKFEKLAIREQLTSTMNEQRGML